MLCFGYTRIDWSILEYIVSILKKPYSELHTQGKLRVSRIHKAHLDVILILQKHILTTSSTYSEYTPSILSAKLSVYLECTRIYWLLEYTLSILKHSQQAWTEPSHTVPSPSLSKLSPQVLVRIWRPAHRSASQIGQAQQTSYTATSPTVQPLWPEPYKAKLY